MRRYPSRALLTSLILALGAPALAAVDPKPLLEQAATFEAQKNYAGAIAIYDSLIKAYPVEARPYELRGWAHYRQGKLPEALADLGTALAFDAGNPRILQRRGIVWRAAGDLDQALSDFQAVIAQVPEQASPRFEAAFTLNKLGRNAEALPHIDKAVALDPTKGQYQLTRAGILGNLGRKDEAISTCDKGVLDNAGNPAMVAAFERLRTHIAKKDDKRSLLDTPRTAAGQAESTQTIERPTKIAPVSSPAKESVITDIDADAVKIDAAQPGVRLKPKPVVINEAAGTIAISVASPETPRAPSAATLAQLPSTPQEGRIPVTMPPPEDLSCVSAEHWAGIVAQVKEGMAQIYGDMSDAELEAFDKQWAPYFEFPAPEILDYFSKLQPLVAEFVFLKEAAGKTTAACDQAQFKLTTALASEDYEEATAHLYSLRQSQGLFLSQNARLQQLAQAAIGLGAPPDTAELKAKAAKRHKRCLDAVSTPPHDIEGVWSGKDVGTWTIQILARFPKDLMLVDTGDGGRGLLQPLNEPNAWLFLQGGGDDKPEEVRPWRFDVIGKSLRVRRYTPRDDEDRAEPGEFRTYACEYKGGITEREQYRAEDETDEARKPYNWEKLFTERFLWHAKTIEVLRSGGLPRETEMARRREWAMANYKSEVNEVIERMELELPRGAERKIDREKAEGRAIERMLALQYYYYGNNPPGFDNCNDTYEFAMLFSGATETGSLPDLDARRRRQSMLLWNLRQKLERMIKYEQDYTIRFHDMTPDKQSSDVKMLGELIKKEEQEDKDISTALTEAKAAIDRDCQDAITEIQGKENEGLDRIAQEKTRMLAYYDETISREQANRPSSDREREFHYRRLRRLNEERAEVGPQAEKDSQQVRQNCNEKVEVARKEAEERKKRAEANAAEQRASVAVRIKHLTTRKTEISSKNIRRLNPAGTDYEVVPLSLVIEEAKARAEEEFDLKGYLLGLVARMDKELPTTKGRFKAEDLSFGSFDGPCMQELPDRVAIISRKSHDEDKGKPGSRLSLEVVAARPDPEAEEAKKREEALALAKKEKLELFQEEIKALNKSLENIAKTMEEVRARPADKDQATQLEGLARDRMAMEANIKAAQDQINFVETGVYQRTRTQWDDYNQQLMMEDSRALANHWEQVNRRLDRFNRLLGTAKPEDRDRLRREWNDAVDSAIKNGCNFDGLEKAAHDIGAQIQGEHIKDRERADAEAATADLKLRIAEGVKKTADTSLTFLTIYATAGVASPSAFFMPTCAESALSTVYSTCTGYIEGGPEAAFKQAAGAFSQVAGLTSLAMDSYQQGVLNHLEDYAQNPQKVRLDENAAGLSAMSWALAETGAKQAAMSMVVSPLALNLKKAINARPQGPKGGIFGPEEIRFKSANEYKQERLFRDKEIQGKHLMQQFKKASEDVRNARGAGKAEFEIKDLVERAESAYKAANSDFHAKNWMKRMAKMDGKLGEQWCEFDAANKGAVIDQTKAILKAKGLSAPEMKCFSNSASKGGVGMDMDLGLIEPPRWLEVPHWKDAGKSMRVPNPAYKEWRNSLTITDPKTGKTTVVHPSEYARHAREAMHEAYRQVYGKSPEEAFLEFTFSDHPEAYKDTAWLGRARRGPNDAPPPWADFANIDPSKAGQAASVTGFKVDRLQPGGMRAAGKVPNAQKHGDKQVNQSALEYGTDDLASMPRYSRLLEQSRGLVKDMDTKLFGAKANTDAFGNEAGNRITINPESPLARMPKPVQTHFLELRTVLNDLAAGRITPSAAERRLYVLTGGQGITEVPQQMRIAFENLGRR